MLPHDGLDMCPPFFLRERLTIGSRGSHFDRRVQAQKFRPLLNALNHHFQEAGLAALVLHGSFGLLGVGRLAVHGRGLLRLAGTLPAIPGIALDHPDTLEFLFPGRIEVADRGLPPGPFDRLEVAGDGRLTNLQLIGNRALRPALEPKLRDSLPALEDFQFANNSDSH